ncbi:MAG: prolyl oligopeptidase family serine peptidase [Defluviitaleaceae bacterium]|nr:prolyl oligopeptidase family serine peptidase [Defluviitaleaceae bacterium]
MRKFILTALLVMGVVAFVACGGNNSGNNSDNSQTSNQQTQQQNQQQSSNQSINLDGSFAEARAGFITNLTRNTGNQFSIPTPPEGVYDLVHFQSNVGSLAAFVSSDPGDGQLHPMVIWVVGGWSQGISEFIWAYPEWDNDQTGSAFKDAGILMMHPSFRGANGNPGYFETMFGEIDDIVAAFNFAASLPYVDPNRIYLAGHSTGGTRALLVAAYTDVFRAVFAFGPQDDIGEHNRTQFTFDLNNEAERALRSPIHWLDDISSPTFIIEGRLGNGAALQRMQNATTNPNVHVHIIENSDHFDYLAPITHLVAQHILDDTDSVSNIAFTTSQLQDAMNQTPILPMPIMVQHYNETANASFLLPAIWQAYWDGPGQYSFMSEYWEDNFWDDPELYLDIYQIDQTMTSSEIALELGIDLAASNFSSPAPGIYIWTGFGGFQEFFSKVVVFQNDGQLVIFDFTVDMRHSVPAQIIFDKIISSISFGI